MDLKYMLISLIQLSEASIMAGKQVPDPVRVAQAMIASHCLAPLFSLEAKLTAPL